MKLSKEQEQILVEMINERLAKKEANKPATTLDQVRKLFIEKFGNNVSYDKKKDDFLLDNKPIKADHFNFVSQYLGTGNVARNMYQILSYINNGNILKAQRAKKISKKRK